MTTPNQTHEYFKVSEGEHEIWMASPLREHDDLDIMPPMQYKLIMPENGMYSYEPIEKFPDVPPLKGEKALKLLEEVKTFYKSGSSNVYLYGRKGTGKSLTAYHALNDLSKTMPVIHIAEYLDDDDIECIMEDFDGNVVFFVDEFEDKFEDMSKNIRTNNIIKHWSNPKNQNIKWIVTGNQEPDKEFKGRPSTCRTLVEMSEISKDTMEEILKEYKDNIHPAVYGYIAMQVRYNYENANSDLVEQCCKLANLCKDMDEYRARARLMNGFDGYTNYEINRDQMFRTYRFSIDALHELHEKVKKATTMEELMEMRLITMKAVTADEEQPFNFDDLKKKVETTINSMVVAKTGKQFA